MIVPLALEFMHEHPASRAMRGQRVRGEILVVRRGAEGMELFIEVNSNPLYDEEQRIRGAVAVERDVTIKTQLAKQLEEEAKVKAELFERVSTDSLPRSTQQASQGRPPGIRRARSGLVTEGSTPATSSRPALCSLTTSIACSIRPGPPVSTTAASLAGALAGAGLPSVKANSTKPSA